MNLLFTMSVSGSIIFTLYLLMKPVFNRCCTARWQYRVLQICILLYLIPYQCLKDQYYILCKTLFGYRNLAKENLRTFKSWNTIYVTPDGQAHYTYWLPVLAIAFVWLGIVSVILYRQIRKYRSYRNKLILLSEASDPNVCTVPAPDDAAPAISGRPVKIIFCPFIKSPLTIGLFRPAVIMPAQYQAEDLSLYLSHEAGHISSHDAIWKLLAFISLLLHWYNPLYYILFHEICVVSEKHCDEMVTAGLDEAQKTHYADLIIESARSHTDSTVLFTGTFSTNQNQTKERILFMNRPKCKPVYSKIITALLICVIALSMPISVLAYQPLSVYHDRQDYKPGTDVMYIIFNDQPCPLDDPFDMDADFSLSDDIIIDESSNQYVITGNNTQTARSCSHEYISAQHRHHVKNGSGCTTYIYEGTYCKKCGYCLRESLIDQITHSICPH